MVPKHSVPNTGKIRKKTSGARFGTNKKTKLRRAIHKPLKTKHFPRAPAISHPFPSFFS